MKYRKKPVVIEARQYNNDRYSYSLLHWINEGQHANEKELARWVNGVLTIPTLEGDHTANIGDWIIKGVAGEFYPCKPDIFEQTYEAVDTELWLPVEDDAAPTCRMCGRPPFQYQESHEGEVAYQCKCGHEY